MTLDTAKRIVLEQGDQASKEAQAVVRGGMNVCDVLDDGKRKYTWVKVLPTKSDAESSIDAALEQHRKKLQPKRIKAIIHKTEENALVSHIQKEENEQFPASKRTPIHLQIISNLKRKFNQFVKIMDEFLEE